MQSRIAHYRQMLGALAALGLALAIAPASAVAVPTISEFPTTPGTGPQAVTTGSDGNLWFVESGGDRIGRMTPAGVVTIFSSGLSSSPGIAGITTGPDGNVWFTESDNDGIGRITPGGVITEYFTGIDGGSEPRDIAPGPGNTLWFTSPGDDQIGRVTIGAPTTVVEFSIPGSNNNPHAITAGPAGDIWFTKQTSPGAIGRVTTSGSFLADYGPTANLPSGIAVGSDGNAWFTASANPGSIGRVTPAGVVTPFSTGLTANGGPWEIATGDDGNLYFTEAAVGGRLGQITPSGAITEFSTGLSSAPWGITNGPDGNIWFSEIAGSRLGRLTLPPAATTNPATALTPTGVTLAASVTPRAQATDVHFEWGLTGAYGTSTTPVAAGSGTIAVTVTQAVTGLVPSTAYNFRAVATNATATVNGADRTFTTSAAAPGVTTTAATTVEQTSATLHATADPNGAAGTYHFEFGLTTAYGDRMPATDAAIAPGTTSQALQQAVSGLAAGTTYHYRVVATNATGTTNGADLSFTTGAPAPFTAPATLPPPVVTPLPIVTPPPALPPVTRPVLGQSATVAAVSGTVLVEIPGTGVYLPLSAASTVPVGTTIDATRGTLKLTNVRDASGKLQTGRFWGGVFTVRQTRGKEASTILTLAAPLACGKSARDLSSVAAKPRTRQLWGSDNKGRFVTRGRSAVATVRGTSWFTRDTCAGTLVRVTSGSVAVRDLVLRRTVIVRAGRSYLARVK